MEREPERRFSNDDVRRILERATKIEKLDGSAISEAELRAIAAEAEIDPKAITRAIAETTGGYPAELASIAEGSTSSIRSIALAGGAGLLTGLVMAVLGDSPRAIPFDFIGLGLIAIGVFMAGREAHGKGWHTAFQLKNALVWTGYAAGWAIVIPSVGLPALMVSSVCAALSAAVGAGINKSGFTPRGLIRKLSGLLASRHDSSDPGERAKRDHDSFRIVTSAPVM